MSGHDPTPLVMAAYYTLVRIVRRHERGTRNDADTLVANPLACALINRIKKSPRLADRGNCKNARLDSLKTYDEAWAKNREAARNDRACCARKRSSTCHRRPGLVPN